MSASESLITKEALSNVYFGFLQNVDGVKVNLEKNLLHLF